MEYIPLEKPIVDIEIKIDELKRIASSQAINLDKEILELKEKAENLRSDMFAKLTAYETTQMARHPKRPTSLEVIQGISDDFIELHGDRNFQDDKAIIGGLGVIGQHRVVFIGHQKGIDTKDNIYRNFGMPRPEGYRKALRLMSMAERFDLPIITFIDTPGAYPGIGAEERGQSEAIAKNIMVMSKLRVPIISVVIGEGGSGGALAISVANRIHMLEHTIYSVISPEGCASILFKDAAHASQAADALQLTAKSAKKYNIIDHIIKEPKGGAHRDHDRTCRSIRRHLLKDLRELKLFSGEELRQFREEKFMTIGSIHDGVMNDA